MESQLVWRGGEGNEREPHGEFSRSTCSSSVGTNQHQPAWVLRVTQKGSSDLQPTAWVKDIRLALRAGAQSLTQGSARYHPLRSDSQSDTRSSGQRRITSVFLTDPLSVAKIPTTPRHGLRGRRAALSPTNQRRRESEAAG